MADSKYFKIQLRVSQFEFKNFKELKEIHGLSAREVVEAFAQSCKPEFITAYNKNGDQVQIKRTSFFTKK